VVRLRFAALFCSLLILPLHTAAAHPIHMSFTEARRVDANRMLQLWVRVFANDFAAAAARSSGTHLGPDSAIAPAVGIAYLQRNLQVFGSNGRALNLTPCGVKRTNDMLLFCLQTGVPFSQARMRNSIMTELFSDQVNVVQTVEGGRRASRLFVRGDGPKMLP